MFYYHDHFEAQARAIEIMQSGSPLTDEELEFVLYVLEMEGN